MTTIKIVILRPVPIWNFIIRAERVIEIEEDIGKALILKGCAKEKGEYDAALAKRKADKEAKAKAKAEAEAEKTETKEDTTPEPDKPKPRRRA